MVTVRLLQHQLQCLLVHILFYMPIYFSEVVNIDVVFVGTVVFFKDGCNLFFVLI